MTENHARLSPALFETIAGLSAGTVSTLTVHPLDVMKTRLQIQKEAATFGNGFGIFRSLISNPRPIQSLYRGLTPNLIGNASSWALFFYFKSLAENQLVLFHQGRSSTASLAGYTPISQDNRDLLTPGDYFIASGISGALITLSTNPIWVLKTRMLSSDKGSAGAYKSMWHGAKQIVKDEGVRGFYKGTAVSLLGISHGAVQFAVYEPLKNVWRSYLAQNQLSERREVKLGNTATLVISGSAKVFAGTVTYPYQVLRSRLQTYHSEERFGVGIRGVAAKIWREEGWKGFYRGLSTNIVRVLPATWVTFLVYENVKHYLPRWAG